MTNYYLWLFLQLSFALICAFVAKKKSRSPYIWFLSGLLFSFLALIAVLILPSLTSSQDNNLEPSENLEEIKELETVESDEETIPEEIADKLWYYLDDNGNQLGPMTFQALVNEWKVKKIKESTLVWNEDMPGWKPLKETSDFKLFTS